MNAKVSIECTDFMTNFSIGLKRICCFKDEAERLWLGFNEVFAWLPLAGLVGKKILCMHGGISAYLNSLEDIRRLDL
ncbi:hypothetical protein OESDEN_11350 [Oesophagostomum dentatum]|uniref:protein-serine/threonine phosphatase n=1 Tax=Oesophagostomum dentatum TaxID=61180 RepID=A0A0B1SZB0_OESDE|nr:hypothetical protein OESDEN_11350 [Oesophagostomum dentatum]